MPTDQSPARSFGLYVHWPYCAAKCPYCDFNAYAQPDADHGAWRQAYVRQLQNYARETDYAACTSIFFGGGTPSLMDPATVAAIIGEADRLWGLERDVEITLEANPSSSEAGKFRQFSLAGVNRLSIGVQSLRGRALRELGRLHDVSEARLAFQSAAGCFGSVSIDLIYGRQRQSLEDWLDELEEACGWGADHLSLYQLTIEPGTAFGERQRVGRLPGLPGEDLAADMQLQTAALCARFGYRQYEVSNYAAPRREGRHNLLYWRCGDYMGIGPGAHGRIAIGGQRVATETELSPDAWLALTNRSGSGEIRRTRLGRREQADEYLMMSIRLAEGTDLARHASLAGCEFDPDTVSELERGGLVRTGNGRLRATVEGMLLLNRIAAELLA